jgi:fructoselysine-6-P-deglycase FrlB-like protein
MKEMTLLPADAYPMLDFRHGPQSNVDPQMLVSVFLSDTALQHEIRFIEDMHALGGVVWAIGEKLDKTRLTGAQHVLELRANWPACRSTCPPSNIWPATGRCR